MEGKLKSKSAFPIEPGDGVGPQVKTVLVVEKKQVPDGLKGAGGACKELRAIGPGNRDGSPVLGCFADKCPLLAQGEKTLSGKLCNNYSVGEGNTKGAAISLGASDLVALKASQPPPALWGNVSDCISADHGAC